MNTFLSAFISGILNTNKIANGYLFHTSNKTQIENEITTFAHSLSKNETLSAPLSSPPLTDFITLSSDKVLSIDEIRALTEQIKYGPSHNMRYICLIPEAEKMSNEAANAFLKTLEEPPENVHFVLGTTLIQNVIPTIRSRCQNLWIPEDEMFHEDEMEPLSFFESQPFIDSFQAAQSISKDKSSYQSQCLYSYTH